MFVIAIQYWQESKSLTKGDIDHSLGKSMGETFDHYLIFCGRTDDYVSEYIHIYIVVEYS